MIYETITYSGASVAGWFGLMWLMGFGLGRLLLHWQRMMEKVR